MSTTSKARRIIQVTLLLAGLATAGGCSWGAESKSREQAAKSDETPATVSPDQPVGQIAGPTMSRAQVLALLEAVNQADVHRSQVAQRRATSPEVKQFAKRLERDHRSLLEQGNEVVAHLKVTPRLGPQGSQLLREQTNEMAELQSASGGAFDQQFVTHEVRAHEQVLATLERAKAQVTQPELRQLLDKSRATLREHLQVARSLQRESAAERPGGRDAAGRASGMQGGGQ